MLPQSASTHYSHSIYHTQITDLFITSLVSLSSKRKTNISEEMWIRCEWYSPIRAKAQQPLVPSWYVYPSSERIQDDKKQQGGTIHVGGRSYIYFIKNVLCWHAKLAQWRYAWGVRVSGGAFSGTEFSSLRLSGRKRSSHAAIIGASDRNQETVWCLLTRIGTMSCPVCVIGNGKVSSLRVSAL